MAITFVAAGTADSASNNSVSPGLPAGIQNGDLLILMLSSRGLGTFGLPSGENWTLYHEGGGASFDSYYHNTSGINQVVFYWAIYTGAAAPTISYSGSTNQTVIGQVCAFRGTDTSAPLANGVDSNTLSNGTNIGAIDALTLGTANSAVVVWGHRADDWTSVATLSGDSQTWAEIGEPDSTSGTDAGMVWDYCITTGTPTITSKTFTVTGGSSNAILGGMFAIKPGSPYDERDANTSGANTSTGVSGARACVAPSVSNTGTATGVSGKVIPAVASASGTTGGTVVGENGNPIQESTGTAAGTTGGSVVGACRFAAGASSTGSNTSTGAGEDVNAGYVGTAAGTSSTNVQSDPAPIYSLEGTSTNSGAAATCSPPWPAGYAVGDYAVMIAEYSSTSEPSLTTAGAFTLLHKSTFDSGAPGSNLAVWHCRVDNTSMTRPVIGAMSDHCHAKIIVIKNVNRNASTVAEQVDVSALTNSTTGTSQSAPSVTTTTDDCLVLAITSRDQDSSSALFTTVANSTLEDDVEQYDSGTATGDGGGFRVVSGIMRTAGATGTIDSTTINSQKWAAVTIALRPLNYVDALQDSDGTAAGTSTVTGNSVIVNESRGVAGGTRLRRKNLVVALLKFNGTHDSTTFTDETGATWTATNAVGGAPPTLSNEVTFFDGDTTSADLNGNTDDGYLTQTYNSNWDLSTTDFTIQMLIRPASVSLARGWFDLRAVNGNRGIYITQPSSDPTLIRFLAGDTNTTSFNVSLSSATGTLAVDTWVWVTCERHGDNFYLYVNGRMVASTTAAGLTIDAAGFDPILFGNRGLTTDFASGKCASFRVVREALYKGVDFEPPTPSSGNYVYAENPNGVSGTVYGGTATVSNTGTADGLTQYIVGGVGDSDGTNTTTGQAIAPFPADGTTSGTGTATGTSGATKKTDYTVSCVATDDVDGQCTATTVAGTAGTCATNAPYAHIGAATHSVSNTSTAAAVGASSAGTVFTGAGTTGGSAVAAAYAAAEGTAAGTCTPSGTSGATKKTDATASGTCTATGAAAWRMGVSGSATGVASDASVSGADKKTEGTAAGTSTVLGETGGGNTVQADGDSDGVGTATGTSGATAKVEFATACTASDNGQAVHVLTRAGTVAGTSDDDAIAAAVGAMTGSAAGTGTLTPAMAVIVGAEFAVAGVATDDFQSPGNITIEANGQSEGTSTADAQSAMILPAVGDDAGTSGFANVAATSLTGTSYDVPCITTIAAEIAKILERQGLSSGISTDAGVGGSNALDKQVSAFFLFFP